MSSTGAWFRGSACLPSGHGAAGLLGLHAEGAHALPERVPVHAEDLGGAELVPLGPRERGADEGRLDRGDRRGVATLLRRRRVEERLDEPGEASLRGGAGG